jgi:hypothetical protein
VSDINNAVDVINRSFDGGRFVLGYYNTQQSCTTLSSAAAVSSASVSVNNQSFTIAKLSVKAYPNPYTSIINFSLVSPVSGKATLEVYNMLGQKLAVVYSGSVDAGIERTVNYNVPAGNRVQLMYKLTVGDQSYHGMLIPVK